MEGSENRIITENWDRAKRFGKIDPDNFNPFSKNPILARFFVKIGRADELGSGVKNLYKFTKIYSGGEPELEEGDVFKTTVPLSVFATSRVTEVSEKVTEVSEKVTEVAEPPGRLAEQSVRVTKNLKVDESILALLIADKNITYTQMAENFGVSRKTIALRIKALKEKGQIARIGSDTNGYWEVYHF